MKFSFVTVFKELVSPYFEASILGRAKESSILEFEFFSPRDYSEDRFKRTDDYAVGGGAGLVFTPAPLFSLLGDIRATDPKAHIVFLTPCAKLFKTSDAKRLAKKEHIVFVCGRYEGIDERVFEEFADEVFSIGDFVLTGGELASLVVCDAISRFVPGVLGNEESLDEESFESHLLEAPSFAKPANFRDMNAPLILLKGNHSKIAKFKRATSEIRTKYFRPDLYEKFLKGFKYEK
jgi:tRNA (guanine37-N1)-methyltransferase